MGSPTGEDGRSEDEGPQRSVMIQPFEIGEFEVTFDEWDACVADGGCDGHYPKEVWGRGTMPVIYVSWNHTKAYLEWLSEKEGANCRLPSEAEWEYAARAGAPTRYAFGDEITQKDANFSGNIGRTTAVGSYPENAWELRDMHGNVWEWVEDCWHDSYDGAPKDNSPSLGADGGDCNFRVLRGGSWNDTQDGARSANRGGDGPFDRLDKFGFRVVCSSPSLDTVR